MRRKEPKKIGDYDVFMLRLRNRLLHKSCRRLLDKIQIYQEMLKDEGIDYERVYRKYVAHLASLRDDVLASGEAANSSSLPPV